MPQTQTNSLNREEQVRHLAHIIWENEGRPEGRAESHWLAAEAQVYSDAAPAPARKPAAKKTAAKS